MLNYVDKAGKAVDGYTAILWQHCRSIWWHQLCRWQSLTAKGYR